MKNERWTRSLWAQQNCTRIHFPCSVAGETERNACKRIHRPMPSYRRTANVHLGTSDEHKKHLPHSVAEKWIARIVPCAYGAGGVCVAHTVASPAPTSLDVVVIMMNTQHTHTHSLARCSLARSARNVIHVERVHRWFSLRRAFTDNGWTFLKLRTLVVSHTLQIHIHKILPPPPQIKKKKIQRRKSCAKKSGREKHTRTHTPTKGH